MHLLYTLFCLSVGHAEKDKKNYCWRNVFFSTAILDRQLKFLVKIPNIYTDLLFTLLSLCLSVMLKKTKTLLFQFKKSLGSFNEIFFLNY